MAAPSEYTCDQCHGTFTPEWTEEEALAEMRENFGNVPEPERAVVCEDCYRMITRTMNG